MLRDRIRGCWMAISGLAVFVCPLGCQVASGQSSAPAVPARRVPASAPAVPARRVPVFTGERDCLWKPSGFMPDGTGIVFNGEYGKKPYKGRCCAQIKFNLSGPGWRGIYWLARGWECRAPGPNLHKLLGVPKSAKEAGIRLVIEGRSSSGATVQFKVGGVTKGRYPDSLDSPVESPWIRLTPEWKRYQIDLKGCDLSNVQGGFCVVANDTHNPGSTRIEFHLDEVWFEAYGKNIPPVPQPKLAPSSPLAPSRPSSPRAKARAALVPARGKQVPVFTGERDCLWNPSGFMPDGSGIIMQTDCLDKPYEGKRCLRIAMKLGGPGWRGIYFLANGWQCLSPGPDVGKLLGREAEKTGIRLVFYGRSEDRASIQAKVGGVARGKFPDSLDFPAESAWITLAPQWKRYEIDLTGKDLSNVQGGFCVVANDTHNPGKDRIEFFLDAIRFEAYERPER